MEVTKGNSSDIPQRCKEEENGLEKGSPHIWWELRVLWLPCSEQIRAKWEMSLKRLEERISEGLMRLTLTWAKLCGKPHSINQSVSLASSKIIINYHTNSGLQDIWVHTPPYTKEEYIRKYVDFFTATPLLCLEHLVQPSCTHFWDTSITFK